MLASITPLGERGRGYRWSVTVVLFSVAAVTGGAASGALLGAAGGLARLALPAAAHPGSARPSAAVALGAVLAAGAALTAVLDARRRAPRGWSRQVDETWLRAYRRWVYATGYGLQLGCGAVTIVPSATTYLAAACTAGLGLAGQPLAGVAVGAAFGAARAAPLLAARTVRSPTRLTALHRRLDGARRPAHTLAVLTASVAAVVLAAAALLALRATGGAA